MMIDDAI